MVQQRSARCQVMTKPCLCFFNQSSSVTVKIKGKVASLMPDLLLDYTDTKWLDLFQVIVKIIHIVQAAYGPTIIHFPGKLLILT
jgi:hypothetical protein